MDIPNTFGGHTITKKSIVKSLYLGCSQFRQLHRPQAGYNVGLALRRVVLDGQILLVAGVLLKP